MKNDSFTNELQATPSSNEAPADTKTNPYKKLVEVTAEHEKRVSDYTDIIDNVIRTTGAGSHFSRYQDVFFGLNRLSSVPELPMHKEGQGLILFTRPDLNLAYDNIAKIRQLSHLSTQDTKSAMHAMRMALDPSTQRGGPVFSKVFRGQLATRDMIYSPLTDVFNPYMTLLSNTCITMSPPPDLGINLYTSPEGVFREQWIMNDGIANFNGYYDITCTFSNIKGNTVLMTFLTWLLYMSYLRIGPLAPHPHNRIRNRMDYNTRIERYKTDETGKYIVEWFHTGASVPKNISIGAGFGLNRLEPMEYENKEISVQFGSVGAIYQDPIQLWEFNKRMITWNPSLSDASRKSNYYKVPFSDIALTNWYGYPLINLSTYELEWWVLKSDYKKLMKGLYSVDEYSAALETATSNYKGRTTPGYL